MVWLRNRSLKFKLIMLLVLLTGTMLLTFGSLALRDFEKDKIAYVLDSSLSHSRSTALQIQAEMGYVVKRIQFFMRGYATAAHTFHPYSISIFPQEDDFQVCASYFLDAKTGTYKAGGILKKATVTEAEVNNLNSLAQEMAPLILKNEIAIQKLPVDSKWLLGLRFDQKNSQPTIVLSVINSSHFMGLFEVAQMQDTYVIDENMHLVLSPVVKTYEIPDKDLVVAFQKVIQGLKSPEGIYQYQKNKEDTWLISAATVGFGGLKVMSVVPRNAALEAVTAMIIKSAMFLLFLFFVTIFLSVLSSTTLTASLKKLLAATHEIAKGNFSVTVDIKGEDEVGSLSSGFNIMTQEIARLMSETAEKARMEGELKTAQLVQSTLFPKNHLVDSDIEIRGFYQPASECSGDWWFYKRMGHQTLFCIGDATGHGVPAALLTAAARSAASSLETFPDLPLNEMIAVFNRAIYNTANGQVMMTFFLGSYDHRTGVVTYANASHEAPYLLRKETLKRKDILFLNDVVGPRLGEQENSTYKLASVQLNVGDRIMLYTDGVTELKNSSGNEWGERALVKCLISCANEHKDLNQTMEQIAQETLNFRNDSPLHDDVTYFMVARQNVEL